VNDLFVSNRDMDHGMVELSSEGIDLVSGGTCWDVYLNYLGVGGRTGRSAIHLGEEPQQLDQVQDDEQSRHCPIG